jgi:dipeptidase E
VRLFLASANLGSRPERLFEIVGPASRVAVVMNAWDGDAASRADEAAQLIALFASLGLDAFELDLREHAEDVDDARLRRRLDGVGLVFAHGGNAFVLRRALRASGLDVLLHELVAADRIAYGGESAGAIVAGPTLRGLEVGDDPGLVPSGYASEVEWSGLGLVDFVVVPHADTDWFAETALRVRDALARAAVPARPLGDDDVVVIGGRAGTTDAP